MKIFFVRHGQTLWNELGKFQGNSDSPLTEVGINQAAKLGKKIKKSGLKFNKIYSSPLGRAVATAEIICQGEYHIEYIDEFKEISLGDMQGIAFKELQEKFPEQYYNFFNHPENYDPTPVKGEFFSDFLTRVENGLYKITKNNAQDANILLVTHGVTLKAICSIIKNNSKDLKIFSKEKVPENTSVTEVLFDGESFEIINFSDTSHL